MKKETFKRVKIKEGLFFKEDFLKLDKKVILFIKEGILFYPIKKKR